MCEIISEDRQQSPLCNIVQKQEYDVTLREKALCGCFCGGLPNFSFFRLISYDFISWIQAEHKCLDYHAPIWRYLNNQVSIQSNSNHICIKVLLIYLVGPFLLIYLFSLSFTWMWHDSMFHSLTDTICR